MVPSRYPHPYGVYRGRGSCAHIQHPSQGCLSILEGVPLTPLLPIPMIISMGRVPVWEWIWAALGTPVIYAPYTIHGTPLYTQYRGVGSIGVPRAITNNSKTIPSTPHTY